MTSLDLQVARGESSAPEWAAPDLKVIQELGLRHEKAYLTFLKDEKNLSVVNLEQIKDDSEVLAQTQQLMGEGAEVIAQGALKHERWFGRPDVLLRVNAPSPRWRWSYQVQDTKLAKETKATTILQLSLYSELLKHVQGSDPEFMWVISPGTGFVGEAHRVADYSAYFRYLKRELLSATENHKEATYPEPVPHCDICRWFQQCDAQRRRDDHLSLVAGIRRQQRNQLEEWNTETMARLAVLRIPLKQRPKHGSREGIERVREQARVQVEGREEKKLKVEAILPVEEERGFCRLPEPNSLDMFVDLEGDPFAGEQGMQYLFGFAYQNGQGEWDYEKRWALSRDEEKSGFEWLVDEITRRQIPNPDMHVYHFGAYEPATFKRLMGLHATRENEIDRLLRAGTFVDLHQAFKQGLRASVEEYSLKKAEAFYGFERKTPLEESRSAMRYVEHRLELGWGDQELPEKIRAAMEGYNREDCVSTGKLRAWLEEQRGNLVKNGTEVARPPKKSGDPSDRLKKKLDRAEALAERLGERLPGASQRTPEQAGEWLLAQLLSWHRREDKRAWQEGYRLADSTDEELLDERVGLTRMKFLKRLKEAKGQQAPVDRYSYLPERTNVRKDKSLYFGDEKFGEVAEIDPSQGIVDVKKTKKTAELHPQTVYMWDAPLNTEAQEASLCRLGEWVATNGVDTAGSYRAGRDLLLRKPPKLSGGERLTQLAGETPVATATRIALALDDSAFAIQGPPGSGKTYAGARMICELVRQGRKVGITALSHKVVRKLLDDVVAAAREKDVGGVRCLHRENDGEESDCVQVAKEQNEEAWDALRSGRANVVGGTSWLWAPQAAFECVDVLFIDEAGQMSLADVLAVSQAAKKLVLLGDPQQLERPTKGSHPDGAEKSALEHLLDGRKTIPEEMGFLLPESWRLHPEVCKFTSELFYENKLGSHAIARSRVLEGHPWVKGAGLWFVPIGHQGNRNSSAEEVEAVARIVEGLLRPEVKWFYSAGNSARLNREKDILIVAPYNAQVADLSARLPGVKVGTVDKFQGQEAAVVIYSLTTSSPEDAPRGMEFLYSLNRLNVATSRAKTAVILVGSPKLLEPECRSPRQMQLANALCRYLEMAKTVDTREVMAV
jgi:predicted RecB family nuclease